MRAFLLLSTVIYGSFLCGSASGAECQCVDVVPPGNHTCEQQKTWGKCDVEWMVKGNFCADSCDRCLCEEDACDDTSPDSTYTCQEQKMFGKCERQWMIDGNFCKLSCGRCKGEFMAFGPGAEDDDDFQDADDLIIGLTPTLLETLSGNNSIDAATKNRQPTDSDGSNQTLIEIADSLLRSVSTRSKFDEDQTFPLTISPLVPAVQLSPRLSSSSTPIPSRVPFNAALDTNTNAQDEDFVQTFAELEAMLSSNLVQDGAVAPSPEPESTRKLCNQTIEETLASRPDLTLLYSIIQEMDLNGLLDDPALGVTFFAPDNKALDQLLEAENEDLSSILADERKLSALKRLVLYHTLPESYAANELKSLAISKTKLGVDFPLFVEAPGSGALTIEGLFSVGQVIEKDALVCGSVMHVVDQVLMPFEDIDAIPSIPFEVVAYPVPDPSPSPAATEPAKEKKEKKCVRKNAMKVLSEYESAEVFVQLLQDLNLMDQIVNSKSPITLFVPRNLAIMEELVEILDAKEGLEQLLTKSNRELTTSIMLYHIVEERLSLNEMSEDTPLVTRNGEMLFPEVRNKRDVSIQSLGSSAKIVAGDVDDNACGIAIHFLDTVLLPFEAGTVAVNNTADSNESDCVDEPLPGITSCIQVVAAALCEDLGIIEGDYCAKSCGRCTSLEDNGALRKMVTNEDTALTKPMGVVASTPFTNEVTAQPNVMTCATIPEFLASNSNFSTAAALIGENLEAVLASPPTPITMFVPTNDAFVELGKLASEKEFDLTNNMGNILGYHIVQGFNTLSTLSEGHLLTTMTGHEVSGTPLQLRVHQEKSRFFIEALGMPQWSRIRDGDHIACKAVIHVIDRVLLPVPMH
eukprot:TRINITY_DN7106_c0_g1_i1.p1 TRINITY_DN7106_c0_g1~~TRINITY_DN7106_c0_g1_i1.p1  ORF type:complete len:861 (+),score=143.45 TRINITY_DN7106_c0_g1_i1:336-2918(+)